MVPDDSAPRIQPDDKLITRPEVLDLMGGISTSKAYEDDELMGLRIYLGPQIVRWILREVCELRDRRVAASTERGAAVRREIRARRERRIAKTVKERRDRQAAAAREG